MPLAHLYLPLLNGDYITLLHSGVFIIFSSIEYHYFPYSSGTYPSSFLMVCPLFPLTLTFPKDLLCSFSFIKKNLSLILIYVIYFSPLLRGSHPSSVPFVLRPLLIYSTLVNANMYTTLLHSLMLVLGSLY